MVSKKEVSSTCIYFRVGDAAGCCGHLSFFKKRMFKE